MKYEVEVLNENKILVYCIHGILLKKEIGQLGVQARERARDIDYAVLFDFRDVVNQVTVSEAHAWVSSYYQRTKGDVQRVKSAHLCKEEDFSFFRFVETSWRNRGINVRLFTDFDEAIKWLSSKK